MILFMVHTTRRRAVLRYVLAMVLALSIATVTHADSGAYRVEVLVFRHTENREEPESVDKVRSFHELFDLDDAMVGDTPRVAEFADGSFASLWRRLDRLSGYEPLTRVAYIQSRIDYHPPVRLHNAEVIAEELHFPGAVIYIDLSRDGMMAPFLAPLYRLDGFVQLRRSRFLHIDLDLEYRVDDPAWLAAFPPVDFEDERFVEASVQRDLFGRSQAEAASPPEPFRVYRLRQSRQVRTDNVHYFDSPTLGALVRVTRTTSAE